MKLGSIGAKAPKSPEILATGVQMTGSNIWDQVLSRIETKVNRHIFYTWFKPTSFVGDDGSTLRSESRTACFEIG